MLKDDGVLACKNAEALLQSACSGIETLRCPFICSSVMIGVALHACSHTLQRKARIWLYHALESEAVGLESAAAPLSA